MRELLAAPHAHRARAACAELRLELDLERAPLGHRIGARVVTEREAVRKVHLERREGRDETDVRRRNGLEELVDADAAERRMDHRSVVREHRLVELAEVRDAIERGGEWRAIEARADHLAVE